MRQLKELLKIKDRAWIYCENEELQKQFLAQAEEEGFLALDGECPTKLSLHPLYGIHEDMTMGYLSIMIWHLSFPENGADPYFRVDYKKYISGEEDYICHTPQFKPLLQ